MGSTEKEVEIRLKEHNLGSNKWTRSNGPFKLVYYEKYMCKEDAKIRENFYKMGFGKVIKKVIIEAIENSGIGAIG